MAQKKAHEVDAYLKKPDPKHRVILVYGPDKGLVSERATRLAQSSGADLTDPFSTIKLDADEAAADAARIADEAHTVAMFGGNRLVWIKGSTQKNLANAIQPVLDLPPKDAIVIVEGGDLKKSAPLRTRIEKCGAAVALPCYQDQARSIDSMIDEEFTAHGISIDRDSKMLLASLLGQDRLASRAEVQKLCLYVGENGSVSAQDIIEICGDASALAIDTVIDAASTGDIATMEHTFKRMISQGNAVFQFIMAAQRHFQMLHQMRVQMDESGASPANLVGGMRPPINFQRKDKVIRALNLWRKAPLERVLSRLETVSLESRANAALSQSLASTALLAIAIEAKQSAH